MGGLASRRTVVRDGVGQGCDKPRVLDPERASSRKVYTRPKCYSDAFIHSSQISRTRSQANIAGANKLSCCSPKITRRALSQKIYYLVYSSTTTMSTTSDDQLKHKAGQVLTRERATARDQKHRYIE